jgi:hypothetical protein
MSPLLPYQHSNKIRSRFSSSSQNIVPTHPLARDKSEFNNPSFLRGYAEEAQDESLSRHLLM